MIPLGVAICAAPLSRIQLGAALGEVTDDLEDGATDEAAARLADLLGRLPCLSTPVDPALLASFARDEARVAGDDEARRRWAAAAYPGGLAPVRVDGVLAVPKGGAVVVDGVAAAVPEARPDQPHLVQRFAADGQRVDAAWQLGASFPDGWVVPAGTPVATTASRERHLAPWIASGALLAVSAGSYALAGLSAGAMARIDTSRGLTGARSRANAFVVASGASLAGAVGIGVTALVVR